MKRASISLVLLCISFFCMSQTVINNSILFEILLDSKMSPSLKNISFVKSMEISPEGFIILSSPDQLYILGHGGMLPLSEKTRRSVNSFTISHEGAIIVIGDNRLHYLDTIGRIQHIFDLSDSKMEVKAGAEVLYLFGKNNRRNEYTISALYKGGQYFELFAFQSPIYTVAEYKEFLLLSVENKLILADSKNKSMIELFSMPNKNEKIISIANDLANNTIYFSTYNSIYRIKNQQIELLTNEFCGILNCIGGDLLIFNPQEKFIIKLNNILKQ